jgi:SAM-dependent methyltransferase
MRGVRSTWPLPALLSWALAWALFGLLRSVEAPLVVAIAMAVAAGAGLSVIGNTPWRRAFVALGFPLSLAASGLAGAMPAWGWLLPLALLALVYPINAWRDAPLFPTPAGALDGLAQLAPLPPNAHVLDAGCGLGDGLRELQRAYPHALLFGLEWSWPLRLACAWRCRFATVRRADIWAADWSGFDLVYLFQRPESMARAIEKAQRELRPGAWMVSLEFDAASVAPTKVLTCADGRRVWLYRVPFRKRG